MTVVASSRLLKSLARPCPEVHSLDNESEMTIDTQGEKDCSVKSENKNGEGGWLAAYM